MQQLTEYLHCAKRNTMKNDTRLNFKCFFEMFSLASAVRDARTIISAVLLNSDPTSQQFRQIHLQQTKSATSGNSFVILEETRQNIAKIFCGADHEVHKSSTSGKQHLSQDRTQL